MSLKTWLDRVLVTVLILAGVGYFVIVRSYDRTPADNSWQYPANLALYAGNDTSFDDILMSQGLDGVALSAVPKNLDLDQHIEKWVDDPDTGKPFLLKVYLPLTDQLNGKLVVVVVHTRDGRLLSFPLLKGVQMNQDGTYSVLEFFRLRYLQIYPEFLARMPLD